MRIYQKALIIILSLGLLAAHQAVASESVVVIVNKDNQQELTQQDVKNIYGDIVYQWKNGARITVYNLPVNSQTREKFSEKIFGESAQRMAAEESNRKITNTINNPTITKRARLVAKLVAKNPDAIGYIPVSVLDQEANVRVILRIE
ncbi:MAG: substrate-binding domain-containing protein [Gammaproteobacteria bacterium]|jgi:ABC-type phosphate transport system substrate-binding protein